MSDYNDGILPEPCLRMDTHFGDEYESIEFGDGTGYIKAAPILAKVGALHEEIDRLRDESAELRKHVRMPDEPLEIDEKDFYVRAFIKWAIEEQPEVKRLEAENAELRELVHDMYEDIVCGCAECFFSEYDEHRGKPSECGNGGCGYRQIADRMRKLGVDA